MDLDKEIDLLRLTRAQQELKIKHQDAMIESCRQGHARSMLALQALADHIQCQPTCCECPVEYCELGFSDDSGVNPDGNECVALIVAWATEQAARRSNDKCNI